MEKKLETATLRGILGSGSEVLLNLPPRHSKLRSPNSRLQIVELLLVKEILHNPGVLNLENSRSQSGGHLGDRSLEQLHLQD